MALYPTASLHHTGAGPHGDPDERCYNDLMALDSARAIEELVAMFHEEPTRMLREYPHLAEDLTFVGEGWSEDEALRDHFRRYYTDYVNDEMWPLSGRLLCED